MTSEYEAAKYCVFVRATVFVALALCGNGDFRASFDWRKNTEGKRIMLSSCARQSQRNLYGMPESITIIKIITTIK